MFIYTRRMRLAGHVARTGEKRNAYRILVVNQKEKDQWECQDVGGWTILKWILERQDRMDWIDLAQDRDQWRAPVNAVMNLRVP
jgi:hypothetical protein